MFAMPTVTLDWRRLSRVRPDTVAFLTLNRPEAANSLDETMIAELATHLKILGKAGPECRAVILRGQGKHFCSGADLGWMKKSAKLTRAANARATAGLSAMYEALFRL